MNSATKRIKQLESKYTADKKIEFVVGAPLPDKLDDGTHYIHIPSLDGNRITTNTDGNVSSIKFIIRTVEEIKEALIAMGIDPEKVLLDE